MENREFGTRHKLIVSDSRKLNSIHDNSVDLVVTSPPYPMIEMWDDLFSNLNPQIKDALSGGSGYSAFELMHKELDKVWEESARVVKPGGIVCINVGDATRSILDNFQLYPNHSRIVAFFLQKGFSPLPEILWRKQTNAPNKFMGSGMLPPGAYVTLEHEYILIFRKGGKREFSKIEEKQRRQASSYFWEERNTWFSDIWELKGTRQKLHGVENRERSAAYPFELVYRLINMFSVRGDTVLDPFLGTGTTAVAAIASGRNSIGVEIDPSFLSTINERVSFAQEFSNRYIRERLSQHISFITERMRTKGPLKYKNRIYGFPVITGQEGELFLQDVKQVRRVSDHTFEVSYNLNPQIEFCKNWEDIILNSSGRSILIMQSESVKPIQFQKTLLSQEQVLENA